MILLNQLYVLNIDVINIIKIINLSKTPLAIIVSNLSLPNNC